jgi:putative transposase
VPLLGSAFVYLAVVLDVFSCRVAGWAMGHYLHATLILGTLDMAASPRDAAGVIHHSDQGS